ncbi:MAG: TRAP transporter substrate-binding protein [Deltaproteobacteria bacterium]|nr:TRAP transporter substrate-binding protein [Deltaproteobacteria bacterium]MBW2208582.1 TRAP transporter substrate-binding protein [Deltaproteobacteria bacterium]
MKKTNFFSVGFIFILMSFIVMSPSMAQAEMKPVELSFAGTFPPKASPYKKAFLPWSKEIEKQTNGLVKVKFYFTQTLAKDKDQYDAVVDGIADIGWMAHSMKTGRFPLISVMELPFLCSNTFVGARVLGELYNKYPQMRKEHDDVHVLFLWTTLPYEIHTTKKPVRKLEDIKGMKLACPPGAAATLQMLGATPVTMGLADVYQAAQKGVTDGVAFAWGIFKARKIYEVTKYHTNIHLGGLPYWSAMNKRTWNKLSPDIQKTITKITTDMMPDTLCRAVTGEMQKGIKIVKERGQEIIEVSPEERARWVAVSKPAYDKWVKVMEAKGLPGKAVLNDALILVEKYSKK